MTGRSAVLVVLIASAVAALIVSAGGARVHRSRARASAAVARFHTVKHDAERVLALRRRSQRVSWGEQPQQDTFRRVNETLGAAGLRDVRVQSVSPAGDHSLEGSVRAGPSPRVQTVRIVLEPVGLEQLGSFLEGWRRDQVLWTITGIDLTRVGTRGAPGSYRATLAASAVYLPHRDPAEERPERGP